MSFILDALRKSEHARQKQSGPGFAEVPVAVTRPRTNRWATAAVALLVVNLLAVGLLLLRRANQQQATPAAATAPAAASETASPPLAASASTPEITAAGTGGPTLAPPVAPLDAITSRPPRGSDSGRNPLAEEVGEGAPGLDPALAEAAASVPAGPPAVTREPRTPARRGSVVYAPLPEAADLPSTPPSAAASSEAPVARGAGELPTADELTARGGLPELHLDLHVYSTAPQQRFIFVNSRKYREGDALQEGPLVEQITARGAVLNYRGSRFELSND